MSRSNVPSLNRLWHTTPEDGHRFDTDRLAHLPPAARRYLTHAIAPGTRLATAVRLTMHGEIRLKGDWFSFRAEQVIHPARGMIWQATVRMYGLPVSGFDRLVDGAGEMRWRLLGLMPLLQMQGPDITRSAAGRLAAETIWLPSHLCGEDVQWEDHDATHTTALFNIAGEQVKISLAIDENGHLEYVRMHRWGNPEGGGFRYVEFGGHIEEEVTFDGYTIPARLRVGWHIQEQGFAENGEFFRASVDRAEFR
jgi:Family of unknown function (DUF6544)